MRTRTWVGFIIVNIIVSAAATLTILFVWEHINTSAPPPTIPALTPTSTEEAAMPPSAPTDVPPTPLPYIVQEGDTLGAIAQTYGISVEELMAVNGLTDPNVLHVGQTLTIPASSTVTPTADSLDATSSAPFVGRGTPLPTLTPSGPPLIVIGQVLGSGDLEAEVVVVRNRGGAVSMEGWTLSDAEGNIFIFPAITLFAETQLRIHSAAGRSTPSDLYWGRSAPAWNGGELITLRNREGNVMDTYIAP